MSTTATMERPAVAGTADGGVPARRAVIRWAWRQTARMPEGLVSGMRR